MVRDRSCIALGVLGWPRGCLLLAGVPVCDIPRFWYRLEDGFPGVAISLLLSSPELGTLYDRGWISGSPITVSGVSSEVKPNVDARRALGGGFNRMASLKAAVRSASSCCDDTD